MCGRARMSLAREAFCKAAGVPQERWKDANLWNPKYNLSPGAWIPVLKLNEADGKPEVQTMRWGLVPSFTKPGEKHDHWRMFNARSEGLTTSPVFRRLLPSKRCVVLLNGFYEWKADAGSRKQPYYIYLTHGAPPPTPSPSKGAGSSGSSGAGGDEALLPVAALWDCVPHGGEGGAPVYTVTLVTTDSAPELGWLHDRMPVLLRDAAAIRAWLGGELPAADTLAPCAPSGLVTAAETAAAGKLELEQGEKERGVEEDQEGNDGQGATREGRDVKQEEKQDVKEEGTEAYGGGAHGEACGNDSGASQQGVQGAGAAGAKEEECTEEAAGIKGAGSSEGEASDDEPRRGGSKGGKPKGGRKRGRAAVGGEDMAHLVERLCVPYSTATPTSTTATAPAAPAAGMVHSSDAGTAHGDGAGVGTGAKHVPPAAARLAWHPVTPDMTKPSFDGPAACRDVRAAKGTIVSFFKAKPKVSQVAHDGGAVAAAAHGVARNADECSGAAGGGVTGGAGAGADAAGQPSAKRARA